MTPQRNSAKTQGLSTVQGGPLYRDYVRSERRGVASVLVDFDRCAPSIEGWSTPVRGSAAALLDSVVFF